MSLTVIRIPLTESKHITHVAYSKLSAYSKKLVRLMAEIYAVSGEDKFSLNYLRQYRDLGSWRDIRDGFYELESRSLGSVRSDGAELYLMAFVPVLQSISNLTE